MCIRDRYHFAETAKVSQAVIPPNRVRYLSEIAENNRSYDQLVQEQSAIASKLYQLNGCLLYTSDAADERSSVDLGGRRIIKKKNRENSRGRHIHKNNTQNREM